MNKAELVNAVAKAVATKKDAAAAVDATLDAITASMKKGQAVTLVGFGTFKVVRRKARTGRNPRTGRTFASGPTPGAPKPLSSASMLPATCVP